MKPGVPAFFDIAVELFVSSMKAAWPDISLVTRKRLRCQRLRNAPNSIRRGMIPAWPQTISNLLCFNLRTTLQMKRIACLLAFLTCWAQFDDLLLPCSSYAQSAPIPGDDDEYIPSKRQEQETRSASLQRPGLVSLRRLPAVFALVCRGRLSEPTSATPLAAPLYLFMSLQR